MFDGQSAREISMGKVSSAVYTNVNGHKSSHGEMKEEVSENGKLLAKVSQKVDATQEGDAKPDSRTRTEVEIPSKNIHKTIVKNGNEEVVDGQDFSNNGQRRSDPEMENGIDKINSYAGLEYTPLDMAEYIFWTGDEKGVILAIQEFLEEGLMSREEAVTFLQSIKNNLEYLQKHYHGMQKTDTRIPNVERYSLRDRLNDLEKTGYEYNSEDEDRVKTDSYDEHFNKYQIQASKMNQYDSPESKAQYSRYESRLKSKNPLNLESYNDRKKRFKEEVRIASNGVNRINLSDEDFEELLERLKVADFLYSEYSLEEVIYQLAKVVFSQSLARGNSEAQLALQKFTSFLEKEARLGQISRSLEKKILDLLIAALTDTLSERPQLLSIVRENLNDMEIPNLTRSALFKNELESTLSGSKNLLEPANESSRSKSTSKN